MSHNPYTMMLSSGVFRPGDLEVRRARESCPAHLAKRLPEFLNNFFDVSTDIESAECVRNNGRNVRRRYPRMHVDDEPMFSFKALLFRLGILLNNEGRPQHQSVQPQQTIGMLEEKVRRLQSLLKIEQTRTIVQQQELERLHDKLKRMDQLQAELAVERVSGQLLAEWLQEADEQLTQIRTGEESRISASGCP